MLGSELRELRKSLGWSQEKLAQKLHITQGAISQWEHDITTPSADQLVSLARVYGISVDKLLGNQEAAPPSEAPKTKEARILAAGLDRMTPEQRERALKMVKLMFEQADLWEGNDAT